MIFYINIYNISVLKFFQWQFSWVAIIQGEIIRVAIFLSPRLDIPLVIIRFAFRDNCEIVLRDIYMSRFQCVGWHVRFRISSTVFFNSFAKSSAHLPNVCCIAQWFQKGNFPSISISILKRYLLFEHDIRFCQKSMKRICPGIEGGRKAFEMMVLTKPL